jgi:hypothetical protein
MLLPPTTAALLLVLLLVAVVVLARLGTRLESARQQLAGAQHAAGLPSRAPLQTGDVVVLPLDILAVDAAKKTLTVARSQALADLLPHLPKATSDAPAENEAYCNPPAAAAAPAAHAAGPLLLLAPWTRGYRVRHVPTPGPPAPVPTAAPGTTVTLALCEAPATDATAAVAPAAAPSLLSAAQNLVNKRVFAAFLLV